MAHRASQEAGFLQASRVCGLNQAKYNTSATYVDLFVRKHPYAPGVKIADQDIATIGAYHTADVPYWFDTLDKYNMFRPTRAWSPGDRKLTDQMAGALIALANTGSPSTARMPWPAWTAAKPSYLTIGQEVTVTDMAINRMDWLAVHPAANVQAGPVRAGPRD
jgi:para-nitrobenzyl esterase